MKHPLVHDLTDEERAVLNEIRARGGLRSDDDVVAVALWKLADHMDIDVPATAFSVPWNHQMNRLLLKERKRGA